MVAALFVIMVGLERVWAELETKYICADHFYQEDNVHKYSTDLKIENLESFENI